MKRIFFIFLIILLPLWIYAQKEMNWWYFGSGAGLNFNQLSTVNGIDNMPAPVTGPINTWEGCFSISDSDGNFVLASDGSIAYNANKAVMTNGTGLLGHSDSAQSGIVIPAPGKPNSYYIVTVSGKAGTGLNYSLVDLTLDGGLGAVTSTKNVNLLAGLIDENIASVRHENKKDYWLIHQQGQDYYVWLITESGFSAPQVYNFPVITPCGTNGEYIVSKLTFSQDNTKFVCCYYNCNAITTGNFDTATGIVSDVKYHTGLSSPYGAEFSPSGEYIFIGSLFQNAFKGKYETLRDGGALTSIGIDIDNFQVGPDQLVYGIKRSTRNLYVIMDPDDGGDDLKTFSNYLLANAGIGLPTFMASWIKMSLDGSDVFCMNTTQSFSLTISGSNPADIVEYTIWDFGDGELNSVIKDTDVSSGTQTHSYTYKRPGTYIITVRSYDENDVLLLEQSNEIKASPCVLPVNPNVHLIKY